MHYPEAVMRDEGYCVDDVPYAQVPVKLRFQRARQVQALRMTGVMKREKMLAEGWQT